MLIEVELNLLVGDVDAELLEGVALEVFEAEDVQDADVLFFVFLPENGTRTGQGFFFFWLFIFLSEVYQIFYSFCVFYNSSSGSDEAANHWFITQVINGLFRMHFYWNIIDRF